MTGHGAIHEKRIDFGRLVGSCFFHGETQGILMTGALSRGLCPVRKDCRFCVHPSTDRIEPIADSAFSCRDDSQQVASKLVCEAVEEAGCVQQIARVAYRCD